MNTVQSGRNQKRFHRRDAESAEVFRPKSMPWTWNGLPKRSVPWSITWAC